MRCGTCGSEPGSPCDLRAHAPGQGSVSLFIANTPSGFAGLWFKDHGDGPEELVLWAPGPADPPSAHAVWEHLAAALPRVTRQ